MVRGKSRPREAVKSAKVRRATWHVGALLPRRIRNSQFPSALALAPADHTRGYHRVDLGFGIDALREHLGRVLAEGRRRTAQARLAAIEPDRRSDAFVPILFDHIAAVDG